MKKYLLLSCTVLFFSCSNVKSLFNNEKSFPQYSNDLTLKKLNASESDKSLIFFTSNFANDTIEVVSGVNRLFKKSFTTENTVGLAGYEVIPNTQKAKISIESIRTHINLKEKELKKYKYIYVSKDGKHILIEYTNKAKMFM